MSKPAMKNQPDKNDELKTDLRHDTMEFSAPTDGDDQLDLDDVTKDDDGISGEELDFLEEDKQLEAAHMAAESDLPADEDNLPDETEEDDYYDNDAPPEGELEGRL